MPSVLRVLLTALQAATLVALVGTPFAPAPALASPLPLPLVTAYADYAHRPDIQTNTRLPRFNHIIAVREEAGNSSARNVPSVISSGAVRRADDTLDNLNLLDTYYTKINQNAHTLNNIQNGMSAGSSSGSNSNYQQQTVSTLSEYSTNVQSFQGILATLAADKGLANYDKSDQLETLLKNFVNSGKYTLSDISNMVNADPTLGPLIGPLVYQIKCILDEVLDAVENLTDSILNDLQPLLQDLIGMATDTACQSGLQIAGLCLVLR